MNLVDHVDQILWSPKIWLRTNLKETLKIQNTLSKPCPIPGDHDSIKFNSLFTQDKFTDIWGLKSEYKNLHKHSQGSYIQ